MDSPDRVIEPAGDSRPIRFEELLEHEKELIDRVNSLLRGIQKDSKHSRNASVDPWATVDYNRRHRVLMISGPRGSGKTSLMLTLLAGWRAAWTERDEDWESITDARHRKDAERLFSDMTSVVRPLKPLDFDPLPPGLPLYGWIVQAFHPLVTRGLNDRQQGERGGLHRDIGHSEQERTGLSWSDPPKSLHEQWQDLYQTAIVGWGSGELRKAFQKDLYDLVLGQEQQHLNWQQLQDRWKSFLDDLFKELDKSPDVFPKNGLLVLPIDDADLQIERDRELILAIRLLYHPRLVYLLTGDTRNLENNLTLEFLSRMMKLDSIRDEDLADVSKERAYNLSNSLKKKVIPSSHILDMDRLTLSQTLEWNEKTATKLLDKIKIKWNVTLRQFLEERPKAPDFDFSCLLFRDLQQLQDQYIKTTSSSPKHLIDFLETLNSEGDPDEFTVGRREEQQIVLHTYPGLIVPVARVYRSILLPQHVEVRVGEKLEFNQERITKKLAGDKRLVQASPLTLFALDLAAKAQNVYVPQHTPRIRPPQCLAWSIWHSESYETWFPWPSIWASSPTELAKRAEQWSKAMRSLHGFVSYEPDAWVDRVAFFWISLHLLWLEENEDQPPTALVADTYMKDVMKDVWSELGKTLKVVKPETRSLPWFEMELPLLTAPEYGLSVNMGTVLLEALLGTDAPQSLPQKWQDARRKAAGDAKRFKRGQTYEDLFEVLADYQDNEVSPEERVKVLFDEIAEAFPSSFWTKSRRAPNRAVKGRP